MTDKIDSIEFTTIDRGSKSDYQGARVKVITRIENWRYLWQKHKPDTPVPSVNFGKYQIVAIFMGQQNSSSYNVEITNVVINQSGTIDLKVNYSLKSTAIDKPTVVQPYHIIQISPS